MAVDTPIRLQALKDGNWPIIDGLHALYEALLRKYLFVGGMPEAVSEFAATGDYTAVRRIQSEILRAYDTDFVKHVPPELLGKIRLLWQNVPAQLAKENKKFIYTALKSGARTREYETALQWLNDAIRTSLAPHADGAQTKDIPLYAFVSQLPMLLRI